MGDLRHVGTPVVRTIEECSELIQALAKAERFGWDNWHPDRPHSSNRFEVLQEIHDVEQVLSELRDFIQANAVRG